jgi:hypothetical protein
MIYKLSSYLIYNNYKDWFVFDYDIINKNILIIHISKNNLLKKFLCKKEFNKNNSTHSLLYSEIIDSENETWVCSNCESIFNNKIICNEHIKNCITI